MNENKEVQKLPPFKRFCMTIGELPTSYVESMTYYESLVWLCNYLETQVIPTINNNSEVVEELKTFVTNYFENLDVQDEIDNKLDEMVEDGTLATVINQEIFGEIEDNLEFLNTSNTLIMGDSYALGLDDELQETLTSWADIVKSLIEAENPDNNCTILAESGSGFIRAGVNNHTFIQLLQSEIANITDKDKIKNIILCGGYNDKDSNLATIKTAVVEFVNYCYTQFPNATVYIGCIGYKNDVSSDGASVREHIVDRVYPAYANNVSSTVLTRSYVYLNGVENILKTIPKSYLYTGSQHPTQNGHNTLGQGIYQAFKTGSVKNYSTGTVTVTNTNASSVSATILARHTGDSLMMAINSFTVNFAEESAINMAVNSEFTLGSYDTNLFIGGCNNNFNVMDVTLAIQDYSNDRYLLTGQLTFNVLGQITFKSWAVDSGASKQINTIKSISVFRNKLLIPELYS